MSQNLKESDLLHKPTRTAHPTRTDLKSLIAAGPQIDIHLMLQQWQEQSRGVLADNKADIGEPEMAETTSLSDTLIEALKTSQMDPVHDYLNALMIDPKEVASFIEEWLLVGTRGKSQQDRAGHFGKFLHALQITLDDSTPAFAQRLQMSPENLSAWIRAEASPNDQQQAAVLQRLVLNLRNA